MELEAEFDIGQSQVLELNILASPDKKECTTIRFYKERGYRDLGRPRDGQPYFHNTPKSIIAIDSSHSTIDDKICIRPPEQTEFLLETDEKLKLRIFIDKSIIEVFANNKVCLIQRVYPKLEESCGISLSSRNGDAELLSFDLWQMAGIYR